MKLTKKEKSYIYDRVKWYGYDLGSTKDFIVKLYFFDEDDYSEDVDGSPAAYYTSMNTLFNILADRGIKYKEVIDINEYLYVEFSSKEIYKYIKYDINKGRRKPTKKEKKAEKRSNEKLKNFFLGLGDLNEAQPFVSGRITSLEDLGVEVTPYEDVDIEDNSIAKRIVDNVSKELEKIKDKYFPQKSDEAVLDKVEKAKSIEKRVYDDINEELKKINEENTIDREYHIEGNIVMEDNEDGNPERAEVKVKMNPEDAMLAYIKGLAEFRKRQTGEDIRVVNEEGEEL